MHLSQKRIWMTMAVMSGIVLTGVAQQREFVEAQRANQTALRHFSWKSRTELTVNGDSRQVRLEQVRYDIDGRLQKTTIGGSAPAAESSRQAPPGPAGALKKRIVAKKTEEFKDMLGDLAALADSYAHVPPEKMKAFAARAVVSREHGAEGSAIRMQGHGLLAPGDQMVLWIDPVRFAMRRIEIAAAHDGHPVTIVADYRGLENGPTYQARAVLRYPDKALEIVVETFDYVRSNTP